MRLDEEALRRPEFVEGEPIELGDGQSWHFPRPVLELYPVPGPDGRLRFDGVRRSFGEDYDRKLDAFVAATGLDEMNAALEVAVDLLDRNYDLTPEDYGSLLRWRPGDEENAAMWQAIADVALGRDAPKPTAVGSA
jgi:hypothetical protein